VSRPKSDHYEKVPFTPHFAHSSVILARAAHKSGTDRLKPHVAGMGQYRTGVPAVLRYAARCDKTPYGDGKHTRPCPCAPSLPITPSALCSTIPPPSTGLASYPARPTATADPSAASHVRQTNDSHATAPTSRPADRRPRAAPHSCSRAQRVASLVS
jgi:hypothetical protein